MISRAINTARGIAAMLLLSLNALLWCGLLFLAALLRPLLPGLERRIAYGARLHPVVDCWVSGNLAILRGLRLTRLTVRGADTLRRDGWYLVVSNHQSWIDIVALQCGLLPHAPVLKFFTKQQLIWLPLIGLSCWVLDFPLMRRFSSEALARNPALRRVDLETTRLACNRFRHAPTTVLNFVEGTRFTQHKQRLQQSPFQHLLRPRAGGAGGVLATLGDRLDAIVDATITYPAAPGSSAAHSPTEAHTSRTNELAGDSAPPAGDPSRTAASGTPTRDDPPTFWHFLCGQVPEILVQLRVMPVPADLIGGDYAEDDAYRTRIRNWLDRLWSEKDAHLAAASAQNTRTS